MAEVNAYTGAQYLGTIVDVPAHNLAPGQVVTATNLICGDTCKVKILQAAEYTDQFYTNRFPSPQWCARVEPLTIWQRPAAEQRKPEPLDMDAAKTACTRDCVELPPAYSVRPRRRPAPPVIRPSVPADIPSPFAKG